MEEGAGAEAGLPRCLAGGLSEKGRRESNEDAAILAVLPPESGLKAFAILSDGMGGHNAGEVASRLAVEILHEKVRAFAARPDVRSLPPAAIETEIRGWIDEANREIHQKGKASAAQKGMGATLALAMVLADDRLVVANVGDSKIFVVSGLSVRQLSVDHTALAEHRRELGFDSVAPEDDASNPFAHALTRSLGQEKKVDPDVRSDVALKPGDVVVLTTDGVTDVLEAERFLTALETTGSIQEAAEEIYRLAFEAGSKDNISVALLSRGAPARLGLGRTGQTAVPEPPADEPPRSSGDDATLVAGAASLPPGEPAARPRASGLALALGFFLLLAALVALGFFLWKPATRPGQGQRGPAVTHAPAPAATPPAAPPVAASVSPTATPAPTLAPSAPAEQTPERGARPASTPRPSSQPARAPGEPSFRTPSVLSGLKPLEYPPTPTETSTPSHTPTPTETGTPTPTVPPPPPGKGSGAPAPRPAPTPGKPATA